MRQLKRFWRSLEELAGSATVPAEWKQVLGEEYQLVRAFLHPGGELATFFPHRDPDLLAYRVVTHGPDDHVGVCDETGECVALPTEELIILELDRSALYGTLAHAFAFEHDDRPESMSAGVSQIGHYVPLGGYRFPVFIAIRHRELDLACVVDRLVALLDTPFLLLAPTRQFLRPAGEDLLRRRKACFLALDEATAIDGARLVATSAARQLIERFRQDVLPDGRQAPEMAFFPTPPEATWSRVRIQLLDGHTASIRAGDAWGVYTYAQMGMANRKNGMPSVQWELLRAFAAEHGTLTWRSPRADRRNQKRRELLSRCLRRFFRIDRDPIVTLEDGWQTRFTVTDQN